MSTFQQQDSAARSNLLAGFRGQGMSDEDATASMNKALGSATAQDMSRYSKNLAGDSIISSTSGIRADETYNTGQAQKETGTIGDLESSLANLIGMVGEQPLADTSSMDEMTSLRQSLGMTSERDEANIKEAGRTAGLEYEPLIKEAEEEKRKGMPKAVIRGGERGGFMSTQFAGAGALAPTEGGDFVGVGGEFENVKSAYDAEISNIKTRQLIAVQNAKTAHRKAIRTGKQEDLDNLRKEISMANDLQKQAETSLINRANLVSGYISDQATRQAGIRKEQEQIRQFEISEGRIQRTQDLQNEKWAKTVSDDMKEETLDNIARMAESGIDLEGLSDEEITTLEIQSGLLSGTFESFYSNLKEEAEMGNMLDKAKLEKAKLAVEQAKASISRTRQLMGETAKNMADKDKDDASKEEREMLDYVDALREKLNKGSLTPKQVHESFTSRYPDTTQEFIKEKLELKETGSMTAWPSGEDVPAGVEWTGKPKGETSKLTRNWIINYYDYNPKKEEGDIDYVMSQINSYKLLGYSDKDILEKLEKK